jgi:hypothetical protein
LIFIGQFVNLKMKDKIVNYLTSGWSKMLLLGVILGYTGFKTLVFNSPKMFFFFLIYFFRTDKNEIISDEEAKKSILKIRRMKEYFEKNQKIPHDEELNKVERKIFENEIQKLKK